MFFFSPVNLKVYQLPWFSTAAITKIAPTRMPRQYEAYFLSSGGLKSKIKVPAGFIFPKASLLGLQMAGLLLFLHMVNLLHKNTLGITSSYKYITFMTSFKDCFLNGESLYWICSIQLLFCMYFFFFFFLSHEACGMLALCQTCTPCIGRQRFNLRTTRIVPMTLINLNYLWKAQSPIQPHFLRYWRTGLLHLSLWWSWGGAQFHPWHKIK